MVRKLHSQPALLQMPGPLSESKPHLTIDSSDYNTLTPDPIKLPVIIINPGLWKATAQCTGLPDQIIGAVVWMDDCDAHS
jgi:hypothetical protein